MTEHVTRDRIDHLLLFLKGVAMGAADVVPGVSGGTIAFISGIYQELLASIRAVNLSALSTLIKNGPKAFWMQINGNFLLVLFSGLVLSYVSLAHVIGYALENHPVLIWSFFFGLILASIIYVFRQLEKLGVHEGIFLALGCLVALAINMLPPLVINDGMLAVFACAALAICAMILPGISGSFILLLLGMYPTIIEAITSFDVPLLSVFMLGCVAGLMSFSRLLTWLLQRFYGATISVLTGFLTGSLVIVWPWKESIDVMIDSKGREVVLSSRILTPGQFESFTGADAQFIPALFLMAFGIVMVLGLEFLGGRRKAAHP